jgi:hypothetical protein
MLLVHGCTLNHLALKPELKDSYCKQEYGGNRHIELVVDRSRASSSRSQLLQSQQSRASEAVQHRPTAREC